MKGRRARESPAPGRDAFLRARDGGRGSPEAPRGRARWDSACGPVGADGAREKEGRLRTPSNCEIPATRGSSEAFFVSPTRLAHASRPREETAERRRPDTGREKTARLMPPRSTQFTRAPARKEAATPPRATASGTGNGLPRQYPPPLCASPLPRLGQSGCPPTDPARPSAGYASLASASSLRATAAPASPSCVRTASWPVPP